MNRRVILLPTICLLKGKWQQVHASIYANRNLLDDKVTVVSAQVVKDDGNGARVLVVEVALFMRCST